MSLLNDLIEKLNEYKRTTGEKVHYILLGEATKRGILNEIRHDPIEVARFNELPVIVVKGVDILMQVGEFKNYAEKKFRPLEVVNGNDKK